MRRRVRWLSLIFLCVFDLVCCVLVLTCTAQLTPARDRHAKKATIRRRRLFPVDIWLTSLPDSSLVSMHEPCQRVGNPRQNSTALIVRDLIPSGNEKVKFAGNIIFLLSYYGNSDLQWDYLGSDPFSNPVPSYSQGTSRIGKSFPIWALPALIWTNSSALPAKFFRPYITSLRLRRNAGTSRSSCSKFVTIAPRMLSSEITSPASRSAAC